MAISKKKLKGIKNFGRQKAEQIPDAKRAESAEKDFVDATVKLNENIENRLQDFRSQAIPILREAYQTRPGATLNVISEEVGKLAEMTQSIMGLMEVIRYPEFRRCAADCLKDLVDICTESVAEQYTLASIRNGESTQ